MMIIKYKIHKTDAIADTSDDTMSELAPSPK